MNHQTPTPFLKAIALKRHGHDIGYCDLDCGQLHHWESCYKCERDREWATVLVQNQGGVIAGVLGIPSPAALRWAKRHLGLAKVRELALGPDDLPFE